ncbi:MAG: hypothetical protein IJ259_05230, partial [Oscillospiraceae bacterium]|nr:hypothetical protein [Oscillospiraceae bacterium]
ISLSCQEKKGNCFWTKKPQGGFFHPVVIQYFSFLSRARPITLPQINPGANSAGRTLQITCESSAFTGNI